MKKSELGTRVEPLGEMLKQYLTIIEGYRERTGKKLLGLSCEMVPLEIIHSFGIQPLYMPTASNPECCGGNDEIPDVYDAVLYPDKCGCMGDRNKNQFLSKKQQFYEFNTFSGYGKEAFITLHESTGRMLRDIFHVNLQDIDMKNLRESVVLYNEIRSLIRGIRELRKVNPAALSNEDLRIILDSASTLPPEIIKEYLLNIFNALRLSGGKETVFRAKGMLYASMSDDSGFFDEMEEEGFMVYEDDLCNGARRFDLSHSAESENLYYEILDSFSYRPLCPSMRNVDERFELLYKMIKKHNVDTVLFLKDSCCRTREIQIDEMRIKLMRSCVDTLTVNRDNCIETIKDYLSSL